jgi:C4-dicarboxylate-specific signal transduction histidine kinase
MENRADPAKDSLLFQDSLAFFGAITASVSHELNNVVSILNQNGGLLEDLLAGVREGRPLRTERLERIAETFRVQTERGIGIIKRLNTFAHSADEPVRAFNLNETAENLVSLAQRPAMLKKATLSFVPSAEPAMVTGSPFMVQQAIFRMIRMALSAAQGNEILALSLQLHDDVISLEMRGVRIHQEQHPEQGRLDVLMRHIGGKADCRSEGGELVFVLTIPRRQPPPLPLPLPGKG